MNAIHVMYVFQHKWTEKGKGMCATLLPTKNPVQPLFHFSLTVKNK